MLTADLVHARVQKGEIKPRYLDPRDPEAHALAEALVKTFHDHVGQTRDALEGALTALLGEGTDYLLHRGMAKLLTDRCEFAVKAPCEPAALRKRLFEEAAKNHPAVLVADALHTVTRDDVIARVAAELGVTSDAVVLAMYADLEGEQVMTQGPDIAAESLASRYNTALAQAVLLRATSLTVKIKTGDPQRYRQLFRFIKFYRLMHEVKGHSEEGYEIKLDGPMSLFQLSQKYGLQLAEFFPALLLCQDWEASAEVLWGKDKRAALFRVNSTQGLVSHYPDKGVYVSREEQWLTERMVAIDTPWALERRSEVIDLGGKGVLIPDFVLKHKVDGRVALVEVLGFWKKEYLEARVELLRLYAPKNLVLAVPWRLRGAEEELTKVPAEVMFFKDVIVAKELVERAERIGLAEATRARAKPERPAKPAKKEQTGKKTQRNSTQS